MLEKGVQTARRISNFYSKLAASIIADPDPVWHYLAYFVSD